MLLFGVALGLDLIDFPSIVWAEVDYSVYVLRQASRRSWRIGQRLPVEVTFLTYAGTLQAEALGLETVWEPRRRVVQTAGHGTPRLSERYV